jgi:bacterial/archaeal transporter family protein
MAGYSFTTLFVKLATRSGTVSSFMVLAVATTIVAMLAIAWMRGELKALLFELDRPALLWASPGAVALTIAVSSLFHALSLGPMGVVCRSTACSS